MRNRFKLLLTSALLFVSFLTVAQNIPARPNPPRLVNDFAGVLSPQQEQELERQLVAYDDTTSNQIAIVLINTLDEYPIEEYALKLFRDWGVGNKKTNNGVVILAAIKDRQIRIEVGYGLEGAIPDITAGHIIDQEIRPAFRSGDYYEGLSLAASSIIKAAAGEYKAPANYRKKKGSGGSALPFGFLVFIIIMIVVFGGRNRGGGGGFMSRRGSGWLGPFILGNMLGRSGSSGWGGGGGGWSDGGGGGFGGFGGGSSGGGGASGSW